MSGNYTLTPNLQLFKPSIAADYGQWGSHLNANSDKLDAAMGPGGGTFLPLSGGTMTGPLNWTATGSTTARAAQDRSADAVNVRDFGAKGDGSTDDTAAFNAAIATGHALYVPKGTYIVGPLTLNQGMFGDGLSTTVLQSSPSTSTSAALITQNDSGPSSIKDMTLDGANLAIYGVLMGTATTQQTGIRFDRLELRHFGSSSATASPLPAGIWCDVAPARPTSKQGITVTNCYAHDIYGDGIYVNGTGCIVSNNVVVNVGSAGIANSLMIDGIIIGNTVNNAGTLPAISADGITGYDQGNLRVLIANNTVDTTQNHGIHFGGNNIQIVGNKVYHPAAFGILLLSSANTPSANGIISNNVIDTPGSGGIRCGYFSRTTVNGNTVSNTGSDAISFIISSDCICAGNIINTVTGNGVYSDTGVNLFVHGNRINGATARSIYDAGASTGMTVFGNIITSEGTATASFASGSVQVRSPLTLATAAGPTIYAGAGAASGTQPNGSLWLRTDGATGSRLYVSAGGGTWAAVAGV